MTEKLQRKPEFSCLDSGSNGIGGYNVSLSY